MREFQEVLEYCELSDLGYRAPKFTWSNYREGYDFIKEHLDRGTANTGWCDLYPDVKVIIEASCTLDHAVLKVWLNGKHNRSSKPCRFRYKAQWALEQGYNKAII
jgi:hypothetical protein